MLIVRPVYKCKSCGNVVETKSPNPLAVEVKIPSNEHGIFFSENDTKVIFDPLMLGLKTAIYQNSLLEPCPNCEIESSLAVSVFELIGFSCR